MTTTPSTTLAFHTHLEALFSPQSDFKPVNGTHDDALTALENQLFEKPQFKNEDVEQYIQFLIDELANDLPNDIEQRQVLPPQNADQSDSPALNWLRAYAEPHRY